MITENERKVLVQSLTGGNDRGVYRNYYAADDSHHSIEAIRTLVDKGFMYAGSYIGGGLRNYRYYHVTPTGASSIGLSLDGAA